MSGLVENLGVIFNTDVNAIRWKGWHKDPCERTTKTVKPQNLKPWQ